MASARFTGSPPRGLSRILYRLPIWLYQRRLGWLMGRRFVMIEHVGRKTGLPRYAVVEVVRHDPATGDVVVASAWGRRSDWFRNTQLAPDVVLTLGRRRFPAVGEDLGDEDAVRELCDYAGRHPIAFRVLLRLIQGDVPTVGLSRCRALARSVSVIRFCPSAGDDR